jgi:ElaB/YqjD/DUF883 family membrane-anchored ribosome-binding protein
LLKQHILGAVDLMAAARSGDQAKVAKASIDQTLKEAVDRMHGNHAAEVRDYDAIHKHILEMADALSDGIVKQFPFRF